jgi:NAD(P)-dependent dehydrogenase (short-subunit alcohol dehydrogenase family)
MIRSLEGKTVLITGANGGLGGHFVQQAIERGAGKVYAAARKPKHWDDPRIEGLVLDITNADDIARAVTAAPDVNLLINNAGAAPAGDALAGPTDVLRGVFETNFFGPLAVANAFTPVLAANGGGTILNILSLAAWISVPTGYAAAKAAMWSATNGLRLVLESQKTHVAGLLVGMVDTPMSAGLDIDKVSAKSVVTKAYDGIAAGLIEILADDMTQGVKQGLSMKAEEFYPALHQQLSVFVA